MTERLHELRRQRDSLKQHLDWLDAEIARETTADPANLPLTDRPRFSTPVAAAASPTPAAADTEALLAQYRSDAQYSPARAKLGCWIVFAGAFAVLGLAIAAWFVLQT